MNLFNGGRVLRLLSFSSFLMYFFFPTSLQREACDVMKPDTRNVPGPMNFDSRTNLNLFPTLTVPMSGRLKNITFYADSVGNGYVSFWKTLGNNSFQLVAKVEISSSRANSLQWLTVEETHYVNEGNVLGVHYKEDAQSGVVAYEQDLLYRTNYTSVYEHFSVTLKDNGWVQGHVIDLQSKKQPTNKGVALHIEICDCVSGNYGGDCSQRCTGNCTNGEFCSPRDGVCVNGCMDGYDYNASALCNILCSPGTYGNNCSSICSHNCINEEVCSPFDGSCEHGCEAGYSYAASTKCHIECDVGMYGSDCAGLCSPHCHEPWRCHHVTGSCVSGCSAGYYPPLCLQSCEDGKYGINCSESCNCRGNNACNIRTGHCDNGCQNGFYEMRTCSQSCIPGTYGYNCSQRCSGNCIDGNTCSPRDGACTTGCRTGYDYDAAPNCSIQCNRARFGTSCAHTCHCKENANCNPVTGECPSGCEQGWHGVSCSVSSDQLHGSSGENSEKVWIASVVILSVLFLAAVATAVAVAFFCKRSGQKAQAIFYTPKRTQNPIKTVGETEMNRTKATFDSVDATSRNRQQKPGKCHSSTYESIQSNSRIKSIPAAYDTLNVYQNE